MDLGSNIQKYRKEAGFTQKELAKKLNVAVGTIQQYELGKRQPRLEFLEKIANVLGVDVWNLYDSYALNTDSDYFLDKMNSFREELNEAGQEKAIEHVELLTKVPEYRKEG